PIVPEAKRTALMTAGLGPAEIRLIVAFEQYPLTRRVNNIPIESKTAENMMHEWLVRNVKHKQVRRAREVRRRRHTDQAALPVIGDMKGKRRLIEQAPIFP